MDKASYIVLTTCISKTKELSLPNPNRMKKIILFSVLLGSLWVAHAQTMYQMEFPITLPSGDQLQAQALYVQSQSDSGFIRIRYTNNASEEVVLYQAELREELVQDGKGNFLEDRFYMMAENPKTWSTGDITSGMLPIFYFEKSTTDNYFQPKSIFYKQANGFIDSSKSLALQWQWLTDKEIDATLLANYFFEDESMLQAIRMPGSKGISEAERDMKIHVLLVADVTDPDIGKQSKMNMQYIENYFIALGKFIGCPVQVRKVMESSYSRSNVVSEIKLLNPGEKDIVVFYFTGHGYRKSKVAPRFPNLDLRAEDSEDYKIQTMNLEEVQAALTAKKARLTLVWSDCCNSYVDASNPIAPPPRVQKKSISQWNEKNVRQLFLAPEKKWVMACAADSSQYAAMAYAFGGLFTYSLLESLENYSSKTVQEATWFQLLESTRVATLRLSRRTDCSKRLGPGGRCYQVPFYRIR
jgi:hypothetical protein